ncbi:hypothetical protein CPB86DRAFT_790727 [Serendipita vermifera]|nr:hypothetical protein CPB86DRAFT_790727 [Serendipita vermifera]
MDASVYDDGGPALYLQQLSVGMVSKIKYDIKVLIDSTRVDVERKAKTLIWVPSRRLEIPQSATVSVAIKEDTRVPLLKRQESQATFNGEEIFQAFWESKYSISKTPNFGQQAAAITLHFIPSPTSEVTRAAVDKVQAAMNEYRPLMKNSTQQQIGTTIKYGTALSEMNPFAKAAFAVVTVTFELLKEQRKYDGGVADLADQIERILPFAKQALEEIVYDDTELLEVAIGRLYNLIMDTAEFTCEYVRRRPASTHHGHS